MINDTCYYLLNLSSKCSFRIIKQISSTSSPFSLPRVPLLTSAQRNGSQRALGLTGACRTACKAGVFRKQGACYRYPFSLIWILEVVDSRATSLTFFYVHASIWLHQFLKAMRDKEGNGLKNAHILGFFRRICKLLFYHIKPVFVFDGGVPALKRQTCLERKLRRKQNAKNLKKTAQKILAMQMRLRAIKETDPKREIFQYLNT
ncbi:hypothetical protein G9A89_008355 [Geosiphon pyriformis]|nr:hypothetical protein G9A89_008355 [Geosiphon pyriformis]